MGYGILEMEKMPEVLKNKPRCVTCVVLTAGILMITVSAISIGVFIGYTYCYIEHETGPRTENITQSTNFQIVQIPMMKSEDVYSNRTINGALVSSFSRVVKIGHALKDAKETLNLYGFNHSLM